MNSGVRKYLQRRKSRRFLKANGEWTEDITEAVEIKNVTEALTYCRRFKLNNMDIVLKFGREEYDIRLEIGNL